VTTCPDCHRHLRETETACPFCARSLPVTALKVVAIVLTPIVLAACYGPPQGGLSPSSPGSGADAGTPPATGDGGTGHPVGN
jgi:hypothetical protein